MIAYEASIASLLTPTAVRELLERQSAFLRLTVHELRGPLSVVNGYLAMVRDGSLGTMPESSMLPVALDTMAASVQAMEALVDGLAAVARQDDGANAFRRQPSRLERVVAGAVAAVDLEARARQVRVERRGVEVEVEVEVNPDLLGIALRNLLSNAIQHSPAASAVVVSMDADDAAATIAVIDEGPGISSADAERVFDPWQRARQSEGLGLGLWIVRRIAEWHGGRVTLETTSAHGSTFAITLPVCPLAETTE